ncbi:MAG: transcription antitermination factor NusB [bacterium]|nr:transcription antitermination factor NusB [bacterium]
MTPDRHHARILAMQALCQNDAHGSGVRATTEAFITAAQEEGATAGTLAYVRELVTLARERRQRFSKAIQAAGSAWDVERMDLVDRNVIRVALAELTLDQVPPKVVLNEAIEIAREYASAESARFVNGVLDRVYKDLRTRNGE